PRRPRHGRPSRARPRRTASVSGEFFASPAIAHQWVVCDAAIHYVVGAARARAFRRARCIRRAHGTTRRMDKTEDPVVSIAPAEVPAGGEFILSGDNWPDAPVSLRLGRARAPIV